MDLAIETPQAADEWALNTCKALGDVPNTGTLPAARNSLTVANMSKPASSLFSKVDAGSI